MDRLAGVRVLLLAIDDRLIGALSEGLDSRGWRTITARDADAAIAAAADFPIEAVVVDLTQGREFTLAAQALKAKAAPRDLPVLALAEASTASDLSGFDLVLAPTAHPAQVASRLESLVRAAVSAEEAEVRAATFAAFGVTLSMPAVDPTPLQILTVGEPAPKFLALRHALSDAGAEVTGAFTAYTAFDYLHDRGFDAVALWAGETHAEALSIAGGMRRNTRLYHVPTILYGRAGVDVGLAEAYRRGLSDVVGADITEVEAAARILSLAAERRREMAIRSALEQARGSGILDAATGLFTRDLFAAHLAGLAKSTRARRRALSVAVLRIGAGPKLARARREGWLERAIPQIGSMIGRLVRAEDTAARLAPDLFALALPATTAAAAAAAAKRIAAVVACTAFEAGGDDAPFTVEFDVGAAEIGIDEKPATALERAAAKALARAA